MNFDDAIKAHVDWKMKLRVYIDKADKSLNPAVVGQDNQCALGKWIYAEGKQFSNVPEYEALRAEHANFHKTAATVITTVDAGNKAQAEKLIESGSQYMSVSNKVVALIMQMKQKAGGK